MKPRLKKFYIYISITILLIFSAYYILSKTGTFHGEEPIYQNINSLEEYSNEKSFGNIPANLLLLYSHPINDKSFVVRTKGDQIISESTIDSNGLFYIDKDKQNNNIILWSNLKEHMYILDEKNEYTPNKIENEQPLNLIIKDKGIEIFAFNTDIQKNTLVMKIDGKQHELEFKPLIINAIHDEHKVYLFSDIVEEERSVVHVINKISGEIEKEITLQENHASDMLFYNNQIVISTEKRLTIIEKDSYNVSYIDINDEILALDRLHIYKDSLYVSYYDKGKTGLATLDENFNTTNNISFDFPYMTAKFEGENMFVMSQLTSGDNKVGKGIIGVFNIENHKKTGQFITPEQEHKLQDFYILEKE
ncbi:hypothetical protein ACOI1C_10720 [Bacillus sp. DJP31]|uniref:hypothetical protein n=1 Tax=Bacillus sp. DJP31 TaxID=3409789 RepID=UPI003BB57356